MIRARRAHVAEQEEQQAELINALHASNDPHAFHLAGKLVRCRQSRERMRVWGGRPPDLRAVLGKDGRYRCEHHACWSCRRKRIRDVGIKAAARFSEADNASSSLVTIADSITGELGEVQQRVKTIARSLRDRRDAAARMWRRWRAVEAIGHVELDPYWPDDIPNLAPDQRTLIPTLPLLTHVTDKPLWVIRTHLAIRHDNIDRDELQATLDCQWPGFGRVHVEAFHEDKPAWENAGGISHYSVKHRQGIEVGLMSEGWSVEWQVRYWTWIHQMKRGMQPLRVSVGPQRTRSSVSFPVMSRSR